MLDEIPRTIAEIAEKVEISKTYCFDLCIEMSKNGALNLRKSGGTWIVWRKNLKAECVAIESSNEKT
ncbi:MAG: hypothetical protein ACFFCS_23010 [Candidatus Hodarchaeota archaeon]